MTEVVTQTAAQMGGWMYRGSKSTAGNAYVFSAPKAAKSSQDETRAAQTREAVLSHIKAMRALGRTSINTRDIAVALELPRSLVERAVSQLDNEGVKVAR